LQAAIRVQQQQPGSRCGGNAALELQAAAGWAVQQLRSTQASQLRCAIAAAAIDHHQLCDEISRAGRQISQ
jgi:hypothetical protein